MVSLVFLVPVPCSSVPFQPSPNKRAQAPVESIEFPMGSKETLARNWSFHFSQVNYISLFIFVVDKDLSKNSCLTHATTVLSEILYTMAILRGSGDIVSMNRVFKQANSNLTPSRSLSNLLMTYLLNPTGLPLLKIMALLEPHAKIGTSPR